MTVPDWWTAADQAELDLLVRELVDQAWPHRGKPGYRAALDDAVGAVLDWKRRRELRSRAVYLRAKQDVTEWRKAA